MSRAPELLELVGNLMRVMLVSERTPKDYQHAIPYNALDFNLIGALRDTPGLRSTQLSDMFGIAPTTTSSVIARLLKKGLIERKRSKEDGRASQLFLSKQGMVLAKTLYKQDIKNMELFLSALDSAEQQTLLNLLGKITNLVNSMDKTVSQNDK